METEDLYTEQLRSAQATLDRHVKELVRKYLSEIRNTSIISGIIAPLSLTLLGVDRLDVSIGYLLTGFCLLISGIVLAQVLHYRYLNERDRELLTGQVDLLAAFTNQNTINNSQESVSNRVKSNFEYQENIKSFYRSVGLGEFDLNLQVRRSKLRRYLFHVHTFFVAGVVSVILSVIINPLLLFIFDLVTRYFAYIQIANIEPTIRFLFLLIIL